MTSDKKIDLVRHPVAKAPGTLTYNLSIAWKTDVEPNFDDHDDDDDVPKADKVSGSNYP